MKIVENSMKSTKNLKTSRVLTLIILIVVNGCRELDVQVDIAFTTIKDLRKSVRLRRSGYLTLDTRLAVPDLVVTAETKIIFATV